MSVFKSLKKWGYPGCDHLNATLRSQEQMEQVWGSIWIHAMPVLGAGDVEIHCAKCGNVVKQETDFCPYCGLAMTPEAMEIVEKRMEALNEDNS